MNHVSVSLTALQPVATRLHRLEVSDSRLGGSADGFLSTGWTALTSLSLHGSRFKDHMLAVVDLPALEVLDMASSKHHGGALQPEQLCCPQLRSLVFQLASSGQGCSLLNLARLATLVVLCRSRQVPTDLGLPASLRRLTVQRSTERDVLDLKWVLLGAVEGINSGAQLRSLTCTNTIPCSYPNAWPWGASSIAHYRGLGAQLSGIKDLSVSGGTTTLLSAVSAIACGAPSLTSLRFTVRGQSCLELPAICSASLKCITGRFHLVGHSVPPTPVILTFLPGCTWLRSVRVQLSSTPKAGTSVRIRCQCSSQECIVPLEEYNRLISGAPQSEVGVHLLPMPRYAQGVQAYTALYACHVAGPEQVLKWSHAVMPGVF